MKRKCFATRVLHTLLHTQYPALSRHMVLSAHANFICPTSKACPHTHTHTHNRHNMMNFTTHMFLNVCILHHMQVFAPSKRPQLPAPSAVNEDLVLEYVYGYRGYDSRANLAYLESGEAVYAAMGMVVVADFAAPTPKQRFFRHHSGGVSCIAVHPDGVHVAR
jgi:hypothetical protein